MVYFEENCIEYCTHPWYCTSYEMLPLCEILSTNKWTVFLSHQNGVTLAHYLACFSAKPVRTVLPSCSRSCIVAANKGGATPMTMWQAKYKTEHRRCVLWPDASQAVQQKKNCDVAKASDCVCVCACDLWPRLPSHNRSPLSFSSSLDLVPSY